MSSPLVERLTVADAAPERAQNVATAVGASCALRPEDLPDAGIDALVVAAATPAHAPLIHLAADRGLPCFCEKPISLDLESTDRALEHVARSGILLQIGFQRRFDAEYLGAREAVRGGRLGRVQLVRLAGHDPAPPPEQYVADSGGIFRDLCIHDFDIAAWVLDSPVTEVYADGTASEPRFARHGDVDVAGAVLRFQSGAVGIVSAARLDPLGYDVRMEILGTLDSVVVGLGPRTPMRSLAPDAPAATAKGWPDFMVRFRSAYELELAAFLQATGNGGANPAPGVDARRALVVALAADRSRAERRPVAVAEIG
ncbi:MAG: Gfo/Idh/MocA family oxidoreductase [Candidatus Dormibacteraeota bacterium]|nr:Gfo/Idh/MocA family oxidoreductase [Candidatus Dormibacteraeota bacterium]